MNFEFMQQVAPQIALPPRGQWITPDQQTGMQEPSAIYGADGMPLPYIQEQGNRQYYSPTGTEGIRTEGAPMQARARATPTPIQGLRGLTPDAPLNPSFQIGGPRVQPPTNLMSSRPQRGAMGRRAVVPIPQETPGANGIAGITAMPNFAAQRQAQIRRSLPEAVRNPTMGMHGPAMTDEQLDRQRMDHIRNSDSRYMGTSEVLDIPNTRGSRMQPAPEYNPHYQAPPNQNLGLYDDMVQQSGGNTLLDMFEQAQFPVPDFLRNLAGRRGPAPVAEGTAVGEMVGTMNRGPIQDIRGRTTNVQRTSQRGAFVRPPNAGQWGGRAPEIEAWLRSGNIRLTEGAGYRTGNALGGGHPAGNSIDVPPNELEAVVARIRANPEFANIPMQPTFIRRGQRFGNGVVATADHYHIDFGPAAQR